MAKKSKQEQIEEAKLLEAQLDKAYYEMCDFAKKNPSEKVSLLKIRLINRILSRIKEMLKDDPTGEFLDLMNEDELPSTSDAVMIMGQHCSALHQYRYRGPVNGWG